MDFETLAKERYSLRKFDARPVEPEKLELIWDRYYKVDKTHRRAVVGTGLGLSIVKSVLEMHSAKYGVESAVGEGSTFWFELPLPEYLAQIDESQQQ